MNKLNYFISCLNIGFIRRQSAVRIRYSGFCLLIINKLVLAGYLYGSEIVRKNNQPVYIIVFLKYSRDRVSWNLASVSKPRKMLFVTHRELLRKWRSSFLLLSTTRGVINRDEALSAGCGGLVLLVVK